MSVRFGLPLYLRRAVLTTTVLPIPIHSLPTREIEMTAPTRKTNTATPPVRTARTSAVDAVTTPADTKPEPTPAAVTPAAKPEPKPESKASKASRSAPLDLSALTVAEAPKPKMTGNPNAGRKKADNSVAEGWLRASWDARTEGEKMGAGKAVTVPTVAVGTLKSRLNMAAAALSLGVAIQTTEQGDNTRVVFAAKVRKAKRTTDKGSEGTDTK